MGSLDWKLRRLRAMSALEASTRLVQAQLLPCVLVK